jgi:hypothetical protein
MARTFNVPLQVRPAAIYGPFAIDGRQVGDNGARIEFARSTDGVWPGTSTDIVLKLTWDFDYGAGFQFAGGTHYFGGVQPARFGGGNRLIESCNIFWPKELVDGVLTPIPPNAARVTLELLAALNIGASLIWL